MGTSLRRTGTIAGGSSAPSHRGFANNTSENKQWSRKERWLRQAAVISPKTTLSCAVDDGGFGLVGMTASQSEATSSSSTCAAPKNSSCLQGPCHRWLCFVIQACVLCDSKSRRCWRISNLSHVDMEDFRLSSRWNLYLHSGVATDTDTLSDSQQQSLWDIPPFPEQHPGMLVCLHCFLVMFNKCQLLCQKWLVLDSGLSVSWGIGWQLWQVTVYVSSATWCVL